MAIPQTSTVVALLQPPKATAWSRFEDRYRGQDLTVLDLCGWLTSTQVDPAWRVVTSEDLYDAEQFGADVLTFLDEWPRQRCGDRSFDDVFQLDGQYSLWWSVGPGNTRQSTRGPLVPPLRKLWIVGRLLEHCRPEQMVVVARPGVWQRRLADQGTAAGCRVVDIEGRTLSRPQRGRGLSRFNVLLATLLSVWIVPLHLILRAGLARALTGRLGRISPANNGLAVVMTNWYPRHVRRTASGPRVWYWNDLVAAIGETIPNASCRYLLHTQRPRNPLRPGSWGIRTVPDALPLPQCFSGLGTYLAGLPRQFRMAVALFRLETHPEFQKSLYFAGAEISDLLLPSLRRGVAKAAIWSRNRAAIARSLQTAGTRGVVVVTEEFYPKGMMTIAAAHSLGWATVGAQHGLVSPANLMYAVPPGHVQGAPSPQKMSVYGDYARRVISDVGSYPRRDVWISGCPRWDSLAATAGGERSGEDATGQSLRTVLLATQPSWNKSEGEHPARLVFEAVRGMPSVRLWVKLHPNDRQRQRYEQLAREFEIDNWELLSNPLPELIPCADIMVTGMSAAVFETLLMGGTKVACLRVENQDDIYPYADSGKVLFPETAEQMRELIEPSSAADPESESRLADFLHTHIGPTVSGNAAATLAQQLHDLLEDRDGDHSRMDTVDRENIPAGCAA